jgi:xanthine dehydrogenase accessory factor
MDDVIGEVAQLHETNERGALASLIWSSGSIPMSERAKMLVRAGGEVTGTIGGGCLEAEIIAVASEVLADGEARITGYTMTEQQAGESGLNCGGSVRILTEPIDPQVDAPLYAGVISTRRERRGCALATLLGGPNTSKLLILEDGSTSGDLGNDSAQQLVASGFAEALDEDGGLLLEVPSSRPTGETLGQDREVFVEPFLPVPELFVFGGGHVGGEIAKLAANVGFSVTIIDDRPTFSNSKRHPDVERCLVASVGEVFSRFVFDRYCYVVAATRGHKEDEVVVEAAVRTQARYIGMLGSERKKVVLWKRLAEGGASADRLAQVYAPIGLNIGADNPQEIAVSVVAELIEVRRGSKKIWKTKAPRPSA